MKKFFYSLISLLFMSTLAVADNSFKMEKPENPENSVTLCAGIAGRNYDSVMKSISAELTKRGYLVIILNMSGSEDILKSLDAGNCAYGPAQKDIHYSLSKSNAGFTATVTPIALLYNEAMQLWCSAESGLDELEDFDENTTVIVDSTGSGSALSWDTMVAIEKEYGSSSSWINARVEYVPLDESVAAISLGNADCAFGVGAIPSNWAEALSQAGATAAWIYDKDLNDLTVGKAPLYNSVRVPASVYGSKFDTYAIPAILFRSNKVKVNAEVDSIVKRMAPSIGVRFNTVKVK